MNFLTGETCCSATTLAAVTDEGGDIDPSCEETLNPGIHVEVTLKCIVHQNDDGSRRLEHGGRFWQRLGTS